MNREGVIDRKLARFLILKTEGDRLKAFKYKRSFRSPFIAKNPNSDVNALEIATLAYNLVSGELLGSTKAASSVTGLVNLTLGFSLAGLNFFDCGDGTGMDDDDPSDEEDEYHS